MLRKIHTLFLLPVFLVMPVSSQSLLGYEYPLGIPVQGGCGTALSLAGTGTGIGNDFFGLTYNPANLGISGRTTFASTVSGDILSLKESSKSSRHLDLGFRLLSLSVPVGSFGSIGVSVEPYSAANIRFRYYKPLHNDPILADTAELGIIEKGGAVSWQIGWGYSIMKKVRVGIAYRYFNFNRSITMTRSTFGSLNDRSVDSTQTKFSTSGIRAGVQVPVGTFTFGISGDYFLINRSRYKQIQKGTLDTLVDTTRGSYDMKPPPALTVGISWQVTPRWLLAVDGGATLWDRYYSSVDPVVQLDNAYHVSGGVQFIPAPNLLTPKLYEITQYRAGIRYTQLPSAYATEIGGTLAAGLPLLASGGLFDIIFEVARRWDTRFDQHRENIYSIKLGINGARKWYQSSDESY